MTKHRVTLQWLLELIRTNRVAEFYNTKTWWQLREKKRKLEHYECERCRKKGKHKQGKTVHHKKPLRKYPELALDINNLENLCDECHYEEHHKNKIDDKPLTPERW